MESSALISEGGPQADVFTKRKGKKKKKRKRTPIGFF
jgi:hypothetical protein